MIQNYTRLYHYIEEYQHLIYDFYSKHVVAFLCSYWNINKEKTIWDDEQIFGGGYERSGNLTGIKFVKYVMLPMYFPEELSTQFDGTETGQQKAQESSIVIPSTYGFTPYAGDMFKIDQTFLQNNDTYPIFIITGVEIHPNTDKRFWKMKIRTYQSETEDNIDDQVTDIYTFFEYDKTIRPLDEAITMANLLSKNIRLKDKLDKVWNDNLGFYH